MKLLKSATECCFLKTEKTFTKNEFNSMACFSLTAHGSNRGIHADVIVYSFAHLHTALRKEGNMLDIN